MPVALLEVSPAEAARIVHRLSKVKSVKSHGQASDEFTALERQRPFTEQDYRRDIVDVAQDRAKVHAVGEQRPLVAVLPCVGRHSLVFVGQAAQHAFEQEQASRFERRRNTSGRVRDRRDKRNASRAHALASHATVSDAQQSARRGRPRRRAHARARTLRSASAPTR
jgi:hypothetical protein